MLRNLFATPNVLGWLIVALLFTFGVIFVGVFDGFVVKTEAKSCCGDRTEVSLFASSASNDEGCECLGTDNCDDTSCSGCSTATSCDPDCGSCNRCTAHCRNRDSDEYMCNGGCEPDD